MSERKGMPDGLLLSSDFTSALPELPNWSIQDLYLDELGETDSMIMGPSTSYFQSVDLGMTQNNVSNINTSTVVSSSQIIPDAKTGRATVGYPTNNNLGRQDRGVGSFSTEKIQKPTCNLAVAGSASTLSSTPKAQLAQRLPRPPGLLRCYACLEIPDKTFVLPCKQLYCQGCLNTLVSIGIANRASFPPRCCKFKGAPGLDIERIKQYLKPDILSRYTTVVEEFSDRNPVYCVNKTCSAYIRVKQVQSTQGQFVSCTKCSFETCKDCKQDRKTHTGHDSVDCPKPEEMMSVSDQALAKNKKWKQCPGCRNLVEKTAGCDSMSCECGTYFCYKCGDKLLDNDNLCRCVAALIPVGQVTERFGITAASTSTSWPMKRESSTPTRLTNSAPQARVNVKREMSGFPGQDVALRTTSHFGPITSHQNQGLSKRQKLMTSKKMEDQKMKLGAELYGQKLKEGPSTVQVTPLTHRSLYSSVPNNPLPNNMQTFDHSRPMMYRSSFNMVTRLEDATPQYTTQSFPPMSTYQSHVPVGHPGSYANWIPPHEDLFYTTQNFPGGSIPYLPSVPLNSNQHAFYDGQRRIIPSANLTHYSHWNPRTAFDTNTIGFAGYQMRVTDSRELNWSGDPRVSFNYGTGDHLRLEQNRYMQPMGQQYWSDVNDRSSGPWRLA